MSESGAIDLASALAEPSRDRELPGLRLWFSAYVAWMGGLAALAMAMFARYEHGDGIALQVWLLALMCFYLSLCNVFLPLPTAWIIFAAASPGVSMFGSAWLQVISVAGLGAVSTAVANLNEYHVLAFLLRFGLGRRLRDTRVYRWAIGWFDKAPFQTLALIGFLPIPIDAIRWLAILRAYSRWRFGLAYFCGRGLRYAAFAWFSVLLQLSGWQIAGIQAAIVVAAVLAKLLGPILVRLLRSPNATL